MSNCDFLSQYFDLFRLNVLFNLTIKVTFYIVVPMTICGYVVKNEKVELILVRGGC